MPARAASACWWPNAACPASHAAASETRSACTTRANCSSNDVPVPAANLLGREGGGFVHLMERLPPERLSIATMALASVRAALD